MIIMVLISIGLDAQPDTNPEKPNTIVEVYDVVAVYREHLDGRGRVRQYTSEMKGEILKYDESTGVLTFKGTDFIEMALGYTGSIFVWKSAPKQHKNLS
jgi:hypothetical protein